MIFDTFGCVTISYLSKLNISGGIHFFIFLGSTSLTPSIRGFSVSIRLESSHNLFVKQSPLVKETLIFLYTTRVYSRFRNRTICRFHGGPFTLWIKLVFFAFWYLASDSFSFNDLRSSTDKSYPMESPLRCCGAEAILFAFSIMSLTVSGDLNVTFNGLPVVSFGPEECSSPVVELFCNFSSFVWVSAYSTGFFRNLGNF